MISIRNNLQKRTKLINNLILLINKRNQSSSSSNETTININNKPEYYDIVICGGGMVGTAMARSLGTDNVFKNLKIALIESSSSKKNEYLKSEIHSNRVCALNETTINLFKQLNCFDFIKQNRYGIVKHMHVWDGSSDSFITFNSNNNNNNNNEQDNNLALIVENDLIQASLLNDLNKYENINIFYSNEINDFNNNNNKINEFVNLKLKNGQQLNTKLIIGSDGVNSFVRNKAGFKVTKWDYDQVAIVGTVKLAQVIYILVQ
jgi:ubiquinone biosynthesis monooxygenase Coq6